MYNYSQLQGVTNKAPAPPPCLNPANANLHVTDNVLKLLTDREGFSSCPYWDKYGKLWTVGFGHTRTAADLKKKGVCITKEQALKLKREDLIDAENCVKRTCPVALTQGQFDGLVSFAFNYGCGGWQKTGVYKEIKKGNIAGASNEFPKHIKSGGKVLPGLITRRKMERSLFDTGNLADNFTGNARNKYEDIIAGTVAALLVVGIIRTAKA